MGPPSRRNELTNWCEKETQTVKKTLSLAVAAFVAVTMTAGCAGLGGQSDEERIQARIQAWSEAMMEQDIDGILAIIADDFHHPDAGGKEQIRLLLEMAIAQGYLDGGRVSWDDMEIRVSDDGQTASAGPIDLSGPPGEIAVTVDMAKGDDGEWYLTHADQY
jgi:ketosteroid isomerase-like protein